MSKVVQQRGGTTAEHEKFTGAPREITVDTNKSTVVVHDGKTKGGTPLATETSVNKLKEDLENKKEALTALSLKNNILSYVDEQGKVHEFSLSKYIDDTNLSRLVSGKIDKNGIATFIRDDDSSFNIDMSTFIGESRLTKDEIINMGFMKTDLSNVEGLSAKFKTLLKKEVGDVAEAGELAVVNAANIMKIQLILIDKGIINE